ncbi:MAG: endolytic transglycosylase MltG [Kineosporiaceae bacterium]
MSERRAARAAERRRKTRSRRTWVSVLIGLGVLVGAVMLAWFTIRPVIASLTEADDYPGPGTGEVTVTIADGASGTSIAQTLRDQDVVKSARAFVDAANKDARAGSIRAGVYPMKKQMSAAGALDLLADPANRRVKRTTVKEGLRAAEIVDVVAKESGIPKADLVAALKLPAEIGLPAEAKGLVEGWLFPATYEISPKATAVDLLTEMVERTQSELGDLGVPREKWQATIIEASLVQAESGHDEDAAKIARVLQNRIAADRPLQLDTTLNYALHRRKVGVATKETTLNSPYNTYRFTGLPAGPICSPGRVAIQGVLTPAVGPWLYFVAVNPDTGETKFATSETEFFALQAELNKWLAAHPGR